MSPTYLLYFSAWKIVAFLPEQLAYRLADLIAHFITRKNGKGVQRLRFNYARVHPEFSPEVLQFNVEEGMRSYLRYWMDTFRLSRWSDQRFVDSVEIIGEHFLRDALATGNGCIVALPHAGNWDRAGAYFCKTKAPVVTVAEHLKPEKLFRKFIQFREALGMEVLDASGHAFGVLAQRLRQGRLIALVADRDLSRSGVTVNFCGYPAKMPAGPALLSLQTKAPLITAFVSYEAHNQKQPWSIRRIIITFEEPITIPRNEDRSEQVAIMTQIFANRTERHLQESVVDWHMLQRIWIDGDFVERP
jgi:KDO2-lipid IV(A) lauroyltransferase